MRKVTLKKNRFLEKNIQSFYQIWNREDRKFSRNNNIIKNLNYQLLNLIENYYTTMYYFIMKFKQNIF